MKEGILTIKELGPRLKLIRQELGITQKELAEALGLRQMLLSKFENGGMVYASVLLDVLCFFRGKVNINYLLQPGDGYDINNDRARFNSNAEFDVILDGKRRAALQKLDELMTQTHQACKDVINDMTDFCKSE